MRSSYLIPKKVNFFEAYDSQFLWYTTIVKYAVSYLTSSVKWMRFFKFSF